MENSFYSGDNLYILHGMDSESVDLIYLDPPFNSKRLYVGTKGSVADGAQFKDVWNWTDVDKESISLLDDYQDLVEYLRTIGRIHSKAMMTYGTYMALRIIKLHRILKKTGGLYLHCDPTASHYLKIILDNIFGKDGFRNEIIWSYRTGGASKKHWSRKHDTILFYAKPEYKHNPIKERIYYDKPFFTTKVDDKGRNYADVYLRDVWEGGVKPVLNLSKKRTGYPTQKPVELLEQIITGSSKKGDIVLDPFCGGGTTCEAAQKLGRSWIGIDLEPQAGDLLAERLGTGQNFTRYDTPPRRTDVKHEKINSKMTTRLLKNQFGRCNGCGEDLLESASKPPPINYNIPKGKGGGDYYENLSLLCGTCLKATHEARMSAIINRQRKPAGKFL